MQRCLLYAVVVFTSKANYLQRERDQYLKRNVAAHDSLSTINIELNLHLVFRISFSCK